MFYILWGRKKACKSLMFPNHGIDHWVFHSERKVAFKSSLSNWVFIQWDNRVINSIIYCTVKVLGHPLCWCTVNWSRKWETQFLVISVALNWNNRAVDNTQWNLPWRISPSVSKFGYRPKSKTSVNNSDYSH